MPLLICQSKEDVSFRILQNPIVFDFKASPPFFVPAVFDFKARGLFFKGGGLFCNQIPLVYSYSYFIVNQYQSTFILNLCRVFEIC